MSFSNPGYSASLQAAVDYAWSKNVVLVAATGNDSSSTPTFPAGDRGVVGVSSTDLTDGLSSSSNYGADTFLAAPGENVASVNGTISGTSASAAIVAGSAALLRASSVGASNGVIVSRLARNADPAGTADQTGNGRVNLARAIVDTSSDSVQPAGAAPVGGGGPFVGPYVAAARQLLLTFAGSGSVTITPNSGTVNAPVACGGTGTNAASQTVTSTCSPNISTSDNAATVTFSASAAGFAGWSAQANLSSSTCSGSTNPCSAVLGSNPALTVTFNANTAPVVDLNGGGAGIDTVSSFTEDGGPSALAPAATVSDDGTNLASATITLTTRPDGNAIESLAATTTGTSITATYTAATGVLTLSGSDTVAHYQQVIRTVTYNNTSQNPATSSRSVTFVVNDGSLSSATATATVSVTAVNDAPVVTTSGGTTAYTENGAGLAIDAGLTVSDADSANLTGATVSITANFASGQDLLGFATQNGITGSYNAGTGVLALTGTASVANYQAALRSVTYANSSDSPSTATRTVTFAATDGSNASNNATKSVSVTAVNDAPVVTTSGGTTAYTENGAGLAIDAGLTVSDADSANLTGATVSITANFASGQDLLGFATQNGITGSYNAGTGVLALTGTASVANYQAALRSVTYANSSDSPSTATRTVTFAATDGSNASNNATKSVSVTAVNDAPLGADKTVSTNEDTAYTFATADFGFTDPSDTPANALAAVKITTLPAAGSLKLDGVAVAVGEFVAAADIAAGKLKFFPAANGNGSPAMRASPSRCRTTVAPPTAATISPTRPTR